MINIKNKKDEPYRPLYLSHRTHRGWRRYVLPMDTRGTPVEVLEQDPINMVLC